MAKERLQKILSECGIASRRKAEELIAAGKVKVNGHVASIGDKADIKIDHITVGGKKIDSPSQSVYILLNKPRGVVTTMKDENGRKCVADLVGDVGTRVYPIGRLDRDSEGMLLLTNDGEFHQAIEHPSNHVPKQYRVSIRPTATEMQLETMRKGIVLDGKKTAPAEVEIFSIEGDKMVLTIVLHEGRNRQIRRMCETLGLEVLRLKRNRIGNVSLSGLGVGKWRNLTAKEVKSLLLSAKPTGKMKAASKYIKDNR
ncbi:MAG: rRNA pseudouridine synthase [Clostridia bacterium]|nr:rRNA pseudouridine synthase [Clostridia bacterium]